MVATALRGIVEAKKDEEMRPKHGPREGASHANPWCIATSVFMVARATVFSAHVQRGAGFFATSSAPIIHSVPITGSAGTGGQGEIRKISGQDRRGRPRAPRR